jgi:hypothetical protein
MSIACQRDEDFDIEQKEQGRGYANFYEKALFVKGDVAIVLWPTQQPLLPFARYASIRTLMELTLW